MESAGVTLVKGDSRGIVRARRLSRRTMANIKQNQFFAFIYNAAGIPIAAGVLYPFFGLLLSPVIAAAAMSFSSVSVVSNALRLRRAKVERNDHDPDDADHDAHHPDNGASARRWSEVEPCIGGTETDTWAGWASGGSSPPRSSRWSSGHSSGLRGDG
jgi:hypothetical protein